MLNTDTLYNYDVRRFFTQFGAHPNGVWSNPIGVLCAVTSDWSHSRAMPKLMHAVKGALPESHKQTH